MIFGREKSEIKSQKLITIIAFVFRLSVFPSFRLFVFTSNELPPPPPAQGRKYPRHRQSKVFQNYVFYRFYQIFTPYERLFCTFEPVQDNF